MNKKVTIKDVALALDTTYSTVSRALNNQSGVSEGLRKAVMLKAKELGYEPNMMAQQLRNGYSKQIGLIVPRINRVFFSNVIHGVEQLAKQKGYNVLICQSNERELEEMENIKSLLANNVAGIIMSFSTQSVYSEVSETLLKMNKPIVQFDRTIEHLDTNKVENDNFGGAYEAVSHIIENGYNKILHFGGPQYISIYKERFEGYKKALKDHSIRFDPAFFFEDVLTKDQGYSVFSQILEDDTIKPDALFSASDFSALGAHIVAAEQNIEIPVDFGIVGFANEPFTEYLGITCVDQFSVEMGKAAFQIVLEEIESKSKVKENKKIVIKSKLITRSSTVK